MRGIGRSGHDQQVGFRAVRLLLELHSLMDAEAMLFVDHGDSQPGEVDTFLDERVGPDDDIDGSRRNSLQHLLPSRRGTREDRHAYPDQGSERCQPEVVLFSEHLGRRHHRTLVSTLDSGEERRHCHDGLARTNFALQQSMHWMRRAHVRADLVDGAPLRTGDDKRQAFEERLDETGLGDVCDPFGVGDLTVLAHRKGDLEAKQFVEHEHARAGAIAAISAGKWMSPMAVSRSTRPRRSTIALGTGSLTGRAVSNALWMARRMYPGPTPPAVEWIGMTLPVISDSVGRSRMSASGLCICSRPR